jgi:hypothetical protein
MPSRWRSRMSSRLMHIAFAVSTTLLTTSWPHSVCQIMWRVASGNNVSPFFSRSECTKYRTIFPHAICARLCLNSVSLWLLFEMFRFALGKNGTEQNALQDSIGLLTPSHLTFRLLHRSHAAVTRSSRRRFSGWARVCEVMDREIRRM